MTSNLRPILVFDLHGVIFSFSITRGLRDFWHAPWSLKLLIMRAALTPGLIWTVLKLIWTGGVVEQAVLAIPTDYPKLAGVVPWVLKIINHQIPKLDMVQLLHDLRAQGYTLLIFSNIGTQSLQILQQKYPAIFSLFSGCLGAGPADNYLHKPDIRAFQKFLVQFGGLAANHAHNFLMIDDRPKNLQAAQACGWQVFRFKSSMQLRKFLLTPR